MATVQDLGAHVAVSSPRHVHTSHARGNHKPYVVFPRGPPMIPMYFHGFPWGCTKDFHAFSWFSLGVDQGFSCVFMLFLRGVLRQTYLILTGFRKRAKNTIIRAACRGSMFIKSEETGIHSSDAQLNSYYAKFLALFFFF